MKTYTEIIIPIRKIIISGVGEELQVEKRYTDSNVSIIFFNLMRLAPH